MTKIAIIGGHITPALATIDELAAKKNVELIFFGRKYATEGANNSSWEHKIISKKNIRFFNVISGRLQRKFTRHTIFSLAKIPVGFVLSFLYLIYTRPKLVVSFGGYLSLPVIFSAWLLGIKSVTHEQSSVPGLANKLNSLFVDKIYVSWKDSQKYFPQDKTVLIGNPVRVDVLKSQTKNKKLISFIKSHKKIIYITGGNQGSHILNSLVLSSLELFSNFGLIHQVGSTNHQGDLDKALKIKSANYLAVDYFGATDVGAVLKSADITISRSGANTIWELASLAKVAILVPLPIAAGNEQYHNAQILQKAGSAVILEQKTLTAEILEKTLVGVDNNLDSFKKHAQNLQKTIPTDAAKKLATQILMYT